MSLKFKGDADAARPWATLGVTVTAVTTGWGGQGRPSLRRRHLNSKDSPGEEQRAGPGRGTRNTTVLIRTSKSLTSLKSRKAFQAVRAQGELEMMETGGRGVLAGGAGPWSPF